MRRYGWLLAASLLLASPVSGATAEDDAPPPLAVVSLANCDDLDSDIQQLLRSAGPALAEDLKPLAEAWKTLANSRGLDRRRPAGAVIRLSAGMRPEGYAFVPVSDLKQWLDSLQAVRHGEGGDPDGPFVVQIKGAPVYVKGKANRWAFLAPDPGMLSDLPDDPKPLLAGLHEKYAVALRFSPDGLPKPLRTLFVEQIKAARDAALAKGKPADKTDGYWAGQQFGFRWTVRTAEAIADELEHLTIGVAGDRRTGALRGEMSIESRAGTPMAGWFAQLAQCKSRLGGLVLPGAYGTVTWCVEFTPGDRTAARAWLKGPVADAMKSLDEKHLGADGMEMAKRTIEGLADLACEMVADGRIEGTFSARIAEAGFTSLGAIHLADAAKVEAAFQQLVAKAKEMDADARSAFLPAEQHRGVRLNPLEIPLSPSLANRERLVQFVGEKLEVVVGFGDRMMYVAAGRNAVRSLKETLDRAAEAPSQPVPTFQYAIALRSVLEFIAPIAPANEREDMDEVLKLLQTAAGKDRVSFTVQARDRGLDLRFDADEGVVKIFLLGVSKALRRQPPPGPFDTALPTEKAAGG